MRLHASLDLIERVSIRLLQYLKFTWWLHAAPCISRPNITGLHTAPVVFEVYTVAP